MKPATGPFRTDVLRDDSVSETMPGNSGIDQISGVAGISYDTLDYTTMSAAPAAGELHIPRTGESDEPDVRVIGIEDESSADQLFGDTGFDSFRSSAHHAATGDSAGYDWLDFSDSGTLNIYFADGTI